MIMHLMPSSDRAAAQSLLAKKQSRKNRIILDQQILDATAASSAAYLMDLERKTKDR